MSAVFASIIDRAKKVKQEIDSIARAPLPQKAKFRLRDLGFFFRFVRPVWKMGALSLVLVMLTTAIRALLPLTSKVFIDFLILRTGYGGLESLLGGLGLGSFAPEIVRLSGSLGFIIGALVAGAIAYSLLFVVEEYLTAVYQQELTYNLQTSLFDHVLRFPMSFIKSKQTGYLMSRVSDDVNLMQYLFSDAVAQILSSAFYIVFGVAILMYMNARLALVIAAVIPAYLLVRTLFSGRIRALSYRERESSAEVSRNMQEAISGVEVVKSYANERREVGRVAARLRDVIGARVRRSVMISVARSFMQATMFLLLLVVVFLGTQDIRAGGMTIGDFVAFISYIVFLSGAINTLFYTYMSFQPVFASMDRLKEMFSIDPEFEYEPENGPLTKRPLKKPAAVRGHVRFDHVTFAYNPREPVLKDISFEVRPGETVAIVGHSGAGKTTMVSLLLKLYRPQAGRVCLDGVDLEELDYGWLRGQVSIVSQDIFLFDDTIENNIKYGRPGASREDVVRAAQQARIHDFILRLPRGYDTLIGERGTKLSVGQRQRVSIARAFLKDTPLIILDEPTSAIDPETELHLKASLDELMEGRTTFIISHRMSLTDLADRIVVIDDGAIGQIGTREELEAVDGVYRRLRSVERRSAAGPAPG